jgi:hypothetical protein
MLNLKFFTDAFFWLHKYRRIYRSYSLERQCEDGPSQSRYHMAEEASICHGNLRVRAEFGYNAETLAAKQVLEGTCQFGEDFNKATK